MKFYDKEVWYIPISGEIWNVTRPQRRVRSWRIFGILIMMYSV